MATIGTLAQNPFESHKDDNPPIEWSANARLTSDTEGIITIKADISPRWHLYGMEMPKDGPKPTKFIFNTEGKVKLVGKMSVDKTPVRKTDTLFNSEVEYWEGKVVFKQKFKLTNKNATDTKIPLKVEYMGCNDITCLPPATKLFNLSILPVR